jgi:hypothetical protein
VAEIIARLGRTTERPERHGTVSNWFAHDETRAEIAAALAAAVLVLRDDDTVELATDRQQVQP